MLGKSLYRLFRVWIVSASLVCLAGVYDPALAVPPSQGDIPVLTYGQTVEGTIDSEQPSMFFSFDAQAGHVVTIRMSTSVEGLDPFLVLNDANQMPLATDDNGGGGTDAQLIFVIPLDGRYIVQATHAGGIAPSSGGAFSLSLTATLDGQPIQDEPVEAVPTQPALPTATPPDLPSDTPVLQGDTVRLAPLVSGASIRDTLDRQVAVRFYWFEGTENSQLSVAPEQMAEFQPLLVLYDARFAELQRAAPGVNLRAALPADGLFFLAVSLPDAGSSGGSYGFSVELSGILTAEGNFIEITYGQSQQGTIDSSVVAVTYRFRGSAGDEVIISMSRAGGDLDSYLYLLDATGQLLYEDNDSGGQNGDARIAYTLPADGEYLIIATKLDQNQGVSSGSYLLDLLSNSPPPPVVETPEAVLPAEFVDAPQMAYGDQVTGELSDITFLDLYVFSGSEGDTVTIRMESQNSDDPNGLDPYLVLLDDQLIPLIDNDDILQGQNRDSLIEYTLPRTGYYGIVAARFDQEQGTSEGPYLLTLESQQNAGEGQPVEGEGRALLDQLGPVELAAGSPTQGTFGAGAAAYVLSASANSVVDLSTTTDPGFDLILILADSNLKEILSSSNGALTAVPLAEAGQYVVLVAPRFGPVNDTGGGYILALSLTGSGSETGEEGSATGPQMIGFGQTVEGVIDEESVSRTYRFVGAAGDRIRIAMEAAPDSTLDCYLELQDAAGVVIDANDDINPGVVRDSRIDIELPADGEYIILAARYVGNDADLTSGAYILTVNRITEEDILQSGVSEQTIPIAYGESLVGEITDEQYLVFYVFEGTAGDVVTISISNLSGNLDSVLYLYQAAGSGWVEIANNDDSPTGGTYEALLADVQLPQTGKYLIALSRYGLASESTLGTYSITLTRE